MSSDTPFSNSQLGAQNQDDLSKDSNKDFLYLDPAGAQHFQSLSSDNNDNGADSDSASSSESSEESGSESGNSFEDDFLLNDLVGDKYENNDDSGSSTISYDDYDEKDEVESIEEKLTWAERRENILNCGFSVLNSPFVTLIISLFTLFLLFGTDLQALAMPLSADKPMLILTTICFFVISVEFIARLLFESLIWVEDIRGDCADSIKKECSCKCDDINRENTSRSISSQLDEYDPLYTVRKGVDSNVVYSQNSLTVSRNSLNTFASNQNTESCINTLNSFGSFSSIQHSQSCHFHPGNQSRLAKFCSFNPFRWLVDTIKYKRVHVRGYLFSFLFFVDVIVILSLIPEVTWISGDSEVDGGPLQDALSTLRASRVSRVGSRAGRIIRIIRFIRVSKLYALWRHYESTRSIHTGVAYETQNTENGEALNASAFKSKLQFQGDVPQIRVSHLGHRLHDRFTSRVILVVMITMIVMPLSIDTYAESNEESMHRHVHDLHEWGSLSNYVDLASAGSFFGSSAVPYVDSSSSWESSLIQIREEFMYYSDGQNVLPDDKGEDRLLYLQLSRSAYAVDPSDLSFNYSVVLPDIPVNKTSRLPGLRDNAFFDEVVTFETSFLFADPAVVAHLVANGDMQDLDNLVADFHQLLQDLSASATGNGSSSFPLPLLPLTQKYLHYVDSRVPRSLLSPQDAFIVRTETIINRKPIVKVEAAFRLSLTCFIIFMLITLNLMLASDAQKLVLQPVEGLIAFVERVARDPVTDISSKDNTGLFETKLLENTVKKMSSLLRVGFGSSGAIVVARHLESRNRTMNYGKLSNPGKQRRGAVSSPFPSPDSNPTKADLSLLWELPTRAQRKLSLTLLANGVLNVPIVPSNGYISHASIAIGNPSVPVAPNMNSLGGSLVVPGVAVMDVGVRAAPLSNVMKSSSSSTDLVHAPYFPGSTRSQAGNSSIGRNMVAGLFSIGRNTRKYPNQLHPSNVHTHDDGVLHGSQAFNLHSIGRSAQRSIGKLSRSLTSKAILTHTPQQPPTTSSSGKASFTTGKEAVSLVSPSASFIAPIGNNKDEVNRRQSLENDATDTVGRSESLSHDVHLLIPPMTPAVAPVGMSFFPEHRKDSVHSFQSLNLDETSAPPEGRDVGSNKLPKGVVSSSSGAGIDSYNWEGSSISRSVLSSNLNASNRESSGARSSSDNANTPAFFQADVPSPDYRVPVTSTRSLVLSSNIPSDTRVHSGNNNRENTINNVSSNALLMGLLSPHGPNTLSVPPSVLMALNAMTQNNAAGAAALNGPLSPPLALAHAISASANLNNVPNALMNTSANVNANAAAFLSATAALRVQKPYVTVPSVQDILGDQVLDLHQSGRTVNTLFVKVAVPNALRLMDILGVHYSVFFNRIASIVHETCHSFGGFPVSNESGEGFMCAWVMDDVWVELIQNKDIVNWVVKGKSSKKVTLHSFEYDLDYSNDYFNFEGVPGAIDPSPVGVDPLASPDTADQARKVRSHFEEYHNVTGWNIPVPKNIQQLLVHPPNVPANGGGGNRRERSASTNSSRRGSYTQMDREKVRGRERDVRSLLQGVSSTLGGLSSPVSQVPQVNDNGSMLIPSNIEEAHSSHRSTSGTPSRTSTASNSNFNSSSESDHDECDDPDAIRGRDHNMKSNNINNKTRRPRLRSRANSKVRSHRSHSYHTSNNPIGSVSSTGTAVHPGGYNRHDPIDRIVQLCEESYQQSHSPQSPLLFPASSSSSALRSPGSGKRGFSAEHGSIASSFKGLLHSLTHSQTQPESDSSHIHIGESEEERSKQSGRVAACATIPTGRSTISALNGHSVQKNTARSIQSQGNPVLEVASELVDEDIEVEVYSEDDIDNAITNSPTKAPKLVEEEKEKSNAAEALPGDTQNTPVGSQGVFRRNETNTTAQDRARSLLQQTIAQITERTILFAIKTRAEILRSKEIMESPELQKLRDAFDKDPELTQWVDNPASSQHSPESSSTISGKTISPRKLKKMHPVFNSYYQPTLNFGIHGGWAIECAVGSPLKIDVTYMSTLHRSLSHMMRSAEMYGNPILMSGHVYIIVSPRVRQLLRKLDVVHLPDIESTAAPPATPGTLPPKTKRGKQDSCTSAARVATALHIFALDTWNWSARLLPAQLDATLLDRSRNQSTMMGPSVSLLARAYPVQYQLSAQSQTAYRQGKAVNSVVPPGTPLASLLPLRQLPSSLTPDVFNTRTTASNRNENLFSVSGASDIIQHEVKFSHYSLNMWDTDPDVQASQAASSPFFRLSHMRAVFAYLSGRWAEARRLFVFVAAARAEALNRGFIAGGYAAATDPGARAAAVVALRILHAQETNRMILLGRAQIQGGGADLEHETEEYLLKDLAFTMESLGVNSNNNSDSVSTTVDNVAGLNEPSTIDINSSVELSSDQKAPTNVVSTTSVSAPNLPPIKVGVLTSHTKEDKSNVATPNTQSKSSACAPATISTPVGGKHKRNSLFSSFYSSNAFQGGSSMYSLRNNDGSRIDETQDPLLICLSQLNLLPTPGVTKPLGWSDFVRAYQFKKEDLDPASLRVYEFMEARGFVSPPSWLGFHIDIDH